MRSTGIEIYDDFLSSDLQNLVWEYCLESSYTYGEYDTPETPPTGMVHEIEGNDIYKLFYEETKDLVPKNFNLYRMYINCFAPTECPYFHTDGEGITFLYYPQYTWDIDVGGETQFVIDNEIKGVFPIPNRLVMFDGNILHRATTFRNKHRFTVAIKYSL